MRPYMNDIAMNTPLRLGSSSATRVWDNHGFHNEAGGSYRGPSNHGNGHDDKG